MGMLPFVVTKNSAVTLSDGSSVVILKVGGVNLPIVMTSFDGKCIISMAAGLDFYDQAFPNIVGRLLDEFGASLEKIEFADAVIYDNEGNETEVCAPVMVIRQGEKSLAIPAFAGDAIAIALARRAPMLIDEAVLLRGIESQKVRDLLAMIEEAVPEVLEC